MRTVTVIAVRAEHGRLDGQVYASNEFPIGSISAVWNNLNTVANAAPVAGKLCSPSSCDARGPPVRPADSCIWECFCLHTT